MNRKHRIHRHALWLAGYLLFVAFLALVMGLPRFAGASLIGAGIAIFVAGATWQPPEGY